MTNANTRLAGSSLRILTSKSSYVLAGRFPSHKVGHGILPALGKSNIYMGKKTAKTSDQGTATLLWHGIILCILSDQGPAKMMAMQVPGKSRRFSLQFGYLSGLFIIYTLQWTPAFAVLLFERSPAIYGQMESSRDLKFA